MTETIHITIDTTAGSGNADHAGRHWSARAEQASTERYQGKIAALRQTEEWQRPFPVLAEVVCTIYFDNKIRRDVENIQTKSYIDGLVDAGVLVDDNFHYVRSFKKVWAYDKHRPRVEIEVRPWDGVA